MQQNQESQQTPLVTEKKSLQNTSRIRIASALFFCGAIILIGYGGWQLFQRYDTTTTPAALPDISKVITVDTDKPEESKPIEDTYIVPADQPRRIKLPTISSEGLIQKVGLTEERAIAVPTNVYFGGWYIDSVAPGEVGLSIIDGHVGGRYSDGIFINLERIAIGDIVEVEYGDKSIRSFEVIDKQTLPEKESAAFLFTKNPNIERQLNLITCGGNFNSTTSSFDKRVIVVTKALP